MDPILAHARVATRLPAQDLERARRFRVPQRERRGPTGRRAGGLDHHSADGIARGLVDDVGAIDRPAECSVLERDGGADAAVADEGGLAPAPREALPDHVVSAEEGRPVDTRGRDERGRLGRAPSRGQECEEQRAGRRKSHGSAGRLKRDMLL